MIMLYFIFGILFLAILDITLWYTAGPDKQFTNLERLFVLICWPFFALSMLIRLITPKRKDDE